MFMFCLLTVITLANVQGSLTVIAGPFAVYNQTLADLSSPLSLIIRNAFIYKVSSAINYTKTKNWLIDWLIN
jgi:hypothetical protein